MNIKFIKTPLILTLLLAGCASQYQVSTNLDKKNFTEYFSPSKVKIYNSEDEFPNKYQYIGLVEGQDCQEKVHYAPPDEINARTQARGVAYQQKANAIIFTGCALIEDDKASKQCVSTTICYGKAYYIAPLKADKK